MRSQNIEYYNVAGMCIAIEGAGKYARAFREYFSTMKINEAHKSPELIIKIESMPDKVQIPAKFYSLSGKIAISDSEYCIKKKNFIYSVSNLFSGQKPVMLKVCWTRKKTLKNEIVSRLKSNDVGVCRDSDKFVDSIMNYEVFWYIFAILLLKQGKVFVHSGIVENHGKALVIGGTGGCGKTSTLLSLMNNEDFKYLAEDFGVLGSDGNAYFTPKRMAIYQSDAKYGNQNVIRALKRLPFLKRMHWKFFQCIGMNPRFRFTPEQIFGSGRLAMAGEIDRILYMSRVSKTYISKQEISINDLCIKIRHASFRELKELGEILNNIRAVGNKDIRKSYPELSELEKEYERILLNILSGRKTEVYEVPLRGKPQDIADCIMENGRGN